MKMTNYEMYVRELLHENNPETGSLLERARAFLETSEACADLLGIFNSELDGNYSERLDGLGAHLEKNGSLRGNLNTYPFGKPSRKIYPEFVGVCKGERTIRSVLDKAENQCENRLSNGTEDKLRPCIAKDLRKIKPFKDISGRAIEHLNDRADKLQDQQHKNGNRYFFRNIDKNRRKRHGDERLRSIAAK